MNNLKIIILVFFVFFVINAKAEESTTATLKSVLVTANPLGHSTTDFVQPVNMISGDDLLKKSQTTIGETLSGELGVRSTYYGPNASRPVIRGLGGDQIHILQNGVSNLDASVVSTDHNVSIDPLSIEKIEVIRGPSALIYGSKAVGGVINVIDNRIPNQPIAEKITSKLDARYNSVSNERSGSFLSEGGAGKLAWHLNGFRRITNDLQIPGYARSRKLRENEPLALGEQEAINKLPNSQSSNFGGLVGVSKFFDVGYFGLALTNFNSNYGTVAEPNVTIKMIQQRLDLAGSLRKPLEFVKEAKFKLGLSDYKHTEFDSGQAGTVFKNRGYDSRVEIIHNKFGFFEGVFGLQSGLSDFSAIGEEAFMPPTKTTTNSGFIFEELPFGKIRFQIGARFDHQEASSKETAVFNYSNSRNSLTKSGSVGFIYRPLKDYSITFSNSYTQRAPNVQELYANGPHLATNSFEIGDQNLKIQQSNGFDLSFCKENGDLTGETNFFYNRFQNFITLTPSGKTDPNYNIPIYNFINLPAEFMGAEAKSNLIVLNANSQKLALELRADYVQAKNLKTNEPLPRIAPLRIGSSIIHRYRKIGFRLDADYNFAQNRVSSSELKTDGYLMLNATIDNSFKIRSNYLVLYLKITNLLNQEARNHVSFLKDIAPLAGRSLMIGIRSEF